MGRWGLFLRHVPGDTLPHGLAQFGEVLEEQAPRVKLRVDRSGCARALSAILARHTVEDVSVEDPPLEEVIAEMFLLAAERAEPGAANPQIA